MIIQVPKVLSRIAGCDEIEKFNQHFCLLFYIDHKNSLNIITSFLLFS